MMKTGRGLAERRESRVRCMLVRRDCWAIEILVGRILLRGAGNGASCIEQRGGCSKPDALCANPSI